LADGKTEFGTAKSVAAMEAVIRNTAIQGWLSVIFVVLSIIVILTALLATIKAIRAGGGQGHEDPAVPSKVFAPAGLIPTAAEKALLAEWNALPVGKRTEKAGHH